MTQETVRRVRFWYGIFLSVFTAVVGILFLAEVSDIYFGATGKPIFTREKVWAHLFPVLIPFCFWIAAVIAGFVLSVVMPYTPKEKRKPNAENTLKKLITRIPQGEGDEYRENMNRVRKAEKARIVVWCVCAAVCLAGAIYSLVYLFTPSHFTTTNFNAEVLEMAKHVLPWVVVSFLLCIGAAIFERELAKRELPYVKKLVAMRGAPLEKKECALASAYAACVKQQRWIVLGVRIGIAVLGIVFLALGIVNGGADNVLLKATKICTECIGLG